MKIFICGDSTAASYNPEETPMTGWGQLLGDFLPEAEIVNLAMPGRSTKTFLTEGRLAPAEREGRQGDLLLIQFAHNDENEKKPERYAEAWTDFSENLRIFIRKAREKGMTPILLTPICMRIWENGELRPTHGDYPEAMRKVAEQTETPLIDLYDGSFRIVASMGEEGSKALFMYKEAGGDPDNAHTRRPGAERFAEYAANRLKSLNLI